jgi:hypothetical protein
MKINTILKDFNLLKKSYRKRKHIKNLLLKRNDSDNKEMLKNTLFGSFLGLIFFYFIKHFIYLTGFEFESFNFFFFIFTSLILSEITRIYIKKILMKNIKKENKLFFTYSNNYFFPNLNKSLQIFFSKNLNKEETEIILFIDTLKEKIFNDYIKEFKETQAQLECQGNSCYNQHAETYANDKLKDITLFEITLYSFKNMNACDITELKLEGVEYILSHFSLNEQIELTQLINKKINNEINKNKILENNLSILNKKNTQLNVSLIFNNKIKKEKI